MHGIFYCGDVFLCGHKALFPSMHLFEDIFCYILVKWSREPTFLGHTSLERIFYIFLGQETSRTSTPMKTLHFHACIEELSCEELC
jgi:hypothetical protein